MNMFKSNGGFTLVELIVVIAILAILAGAAIPAYSGYIARANDTAVLAELEAVETAAYAACAVEGTAPVKITVATDGTVVVYTSVDPAKTVEIDEFFAGKVDAKALSNHSTYKTNGCTWYAADPDGDVKDEAGNQKFAAGWNAGEYTVETPETPDEGE